MRPNERRDQSSAGTREQQVLYACAAGRQSAEWSSVLFVSGAREPTDSVAQRTATKTDTTHNGISEKPLDR